MCLFLQKTIAINLSNTWTAVRPSLDTIVYWIEIIRTSSQKKQLKPDLGSGSETLEFKV